MSSILVTCAGSGVGQSVIDSLNDLRKHKVIGCDSNLNVYANNFCDSFFCSLSIFESGYIDFILNESVNRNIDLIIPGHDYELILFSRNIEKFKRKKIEVLVSNADMIEISRDKHKWYDYFSELNCPVVLTYKLSEYIINPDLTIFPAIIKPSAGSASQGINIVKNFDELKLIKNISESDIIQPYLFPEKTDPNYQIINTMIEQGRFVQMSEISIQLVFTKRSEYAGCFISKNTLKNGVPVFVDPIDPDRFEYISDVMKFVPVLIEKKVSGPVNIQGRITTNGLECFEMNMRFTGITGTRSKLGFNEVSFLVDDALSKDGYLQGYSSNKVGVRQVACTTIERNDSTLAKEKIYSVLGGGYIGSSIINALISERGCKKIYVICRIESYERYLEDFKHPAICVLTDTSTNLASALSESDVLINCVGALAYESELNQYGSIEYQYGMAQKIIKANIPLVINLSSQSLYDQSLDISKNEQETILINSLYTFQKRMSECFFNSINSFSPASKVVSLRLSRVIGGGGGGFFVHVVKSLSENKVIDVPYGNNKTNLIDIRDVAGAVIFLSRDVKKDLLPGIINLGGTDLSIKGYCELVQKYFKTSRANLVHYSDLTTVKVSSMVNSDKILHLGWENRYSIEETIDSIYKKSASS